MIKPDDTNIKNRHARLWALISAQGVEAWLRDKAEEANLENLVYLCKFAFFTGLITKAEIAAVLELDRPQRKQLVKSWYDDHREKGCGTC